VVFLSLQLEIYPNLKVYEIKHFDYKGSHSKDKVNTEGNLVHSFCHSSFIHLLDSCLLLLVYVTPDGSLLGQVGDEGLSGALNIHFEQAIVPVLLHPVSCVEVPSEFTMTALLTLDLLAMHLHYVFFFLEVSAVSD